MQLLFCSVHSWPDCTRAGALPHKNTAQAHPKAHWHTQLVFISSISASIMEIKGFVWWNSFRGLTGIYCTSQINDIWELQEHKPTVTVGQDAGIGNKTLPWFETPKMVIRDFRIEITVQEDHECQPCLVFKRAFKIESLIYFKEATRNLKLVCSEWVQRQKLWLQQQAVDFSC